MASYAEYLKSLGATDEDIKVLDSPITRKAYEKMVADNEAAVNQERANSQQAMQGYREEMNNWYEQKVLPEWESYKTETATAKANEARARAIVSEASKSNEGLKQVAKNMGWDIEGDRSPAQVQQQTNPNRDYYTKDELVKAFGITEGSILKAQSIASEWGQFYPGQYLDWDKLNADAKAINKDIQVHFREKYKIPEMRAKMEQDKVTAREEAIRKEEREKVASEYASKYGNPMTRPPMPSDNPFAKINRPATDSKQPWERPTGEFDRVTEASKRVEQKMKEKGFTN
jgi:hypothetical protein